MTDIYDALLNGENVPVDNADLVARLRKQRALGQLAQLSGAPGLSKLGPTLQSSADQEAEDVYKTRENARLRADALKQAADIAAEHEKDRMALGAQTAADRASTRALQQSMLDERLQSGRQTQDNKATVAAQKVKDSAAVATNSIDETIAAVDRLAKHPGLGGIYGIQHQFPNFPGGEAAGAKALLDSVVAKEGLQGMASMRQQGGTFGRTTNIEFQALQNGVAPLQDQHQDVSQVQQSLALYKKQLLKAKERIAAAADADANAAVNGAGPGTAAGGHVTTTQGFLAGHALPLSRSRGKETASTLPSETLEQKAKRLGLGQ
jgi:hypothetical protein